MKIIGICLMAVILIPSPVLGWQAAKKKLVNWFNLDKEEDGVFGMSTEKAYRELLKNKKNTEVIVAIIDSGVDIEHEDLKNKIWTNDDEIPDNGIDDDRNGYIDDIHGWNFNGGKDGTNVLYDNWEITRLYVKYRKTYNNRGLKNKLPEEKESYEKYIAIKEEFEKKLKKAQTNYITLKKTYKKYMDSRKRVSAYLKSPYFSDQRVEAIDTNDKAVMEAKKILLHYHKHNWGKSTFENAIRFSERLVKYKLNPDYDPRHIVGDNYTDKTEKYYGNNNVVGPDPWHGTVNAGIIGADRNNKIGIKGIADNVKLMILRIAPASGDERDKDVANAIYYAVDNGAQIINMSIAKTHSPDKKYVDRAVKYAEKSGILLVTGSGNGARNIDKKPLYPNPRYLDTKLECNTWIVASASSWKGSDNLPAPFTNYSKRNVDLFAPGVDILTTSPGNKYDNVEGTSQACPMVSGAAALIWSYYPDLTVHQLKEILLKSVVKYEKKMVKCPGNPSKTIEFGELSRTGGIINVYRAILMAQDLFN